MAVPCPADAGGDSSGFPSALGLARVVAVTKIRNKAGSPSEAEPGTRKEDGLEAYRGFPKPFEAEEWHD